MRLDIAVCYTIWEYCFSTLDYLDPQNKAKLILNEIQRRRVNLNQPLQDYYEAYLKNAGGNLWDTYQQWFAKQMLYADYIQFVPDTLSATDVDNITPDEYFRTVANIAYHNQDKVIFSEQFATHHPDLANIGILRMDADTIVDRNADNYYNHYHFPIIRKRIQHSESSTDLSQWLKRIIQSEHNFDIIDGYIYQARRNFKTYFLPHIPTGANIRIYTLLDHISEAQLQHEFTNSAYNRWHVEVYVIANKKEQHARNILTDNYFIQLEKGMSIFGRHGATDQSDINVDYRKNIADTTMPTSRRIV